MSNNQGSDSSKIYIKWNIDEEALRKAFPNAQEVICFTNPAKPYAFISFANEAEAAEALKTCPSSIDAPVKVEAIQPRVHKFSNTFPGRPQFVRDFSDCQIITCVPDVSMCPLTSKAKLITIKDEICPNGNGRIYKKSNYETRHQQTIQFVPQLGAHLASDVTLGGLDLKIVSVKVSILEDGPLISVLVAHPESGASSVVSLRRLVNPDGTFEYRRHCFNLLCNPEDLETKSDDDFVAVQFVSVESITMDETTGVWNDLRLSVDGCTVPLSVFKKETFKRKDVKKNEDGSISKDFVSVAPEAK